MTVDYKAKYLDLRSKFTKSCDRYYRTGYEEGLKQGEMQAQQAQMQEQQAMEMMQQGIDPETGMPMEPKIDPETGMPIEDQGAMGESQPMEGEEIQEGSELDQHINELEGLVAKGEKPKVTDIRKVVDSITSLRKSQKQQLKSNHKEVATSKQKDIVDNILKKWENEAKDEKVLENLETMIENGGIKI